ncbi:transglycosylase domain-containing protein [Sediminitomix flava]|uniref:Penicillin-binding protein 1A n=1 Tax=Sediminitomix flava TaxID=379075 RepID=A0A315ZBC7_SEDFL|nr:transglycosylase domain-containing protein [Sediminitomix flava]PWJ42602.1 penicillin-binding protein 1A [Sediminitomix flava]
MYQRIVKVLWVIFGIGLLCLVLWPFAIKNNWGNLVGKMPDPKVLENPKNDLASELYSADGVLLGKYFRYNRTKVPYDSLSTNLIDALISSEDIRYFDHSGIDMIGTFAAPYYLLKGNKRGSSTITQQLAKILFRTRRDEGLQGLLNSGYGFLPTVINKFKEWVLAYELEKAYTKEEIIEMYMNTFEFGSNAFGIDVASKTFFDTTPSQLTVSQSAMLVAMLRNPTKYSPVYHPEKAKEARNVVLNQMAKYKEIDKVEADSLKSADLGLQYNVENHVKGLAPYFRAEIRKVLLDFCRQQNLDLFSDGLKIYTTIDSRMQKYAEEAVNQHMKHQNKLFKDHWKRPSHIKANDYNWGPWIDREGKQIEGFLKYEMKKTQAYRNMRRKYDGDSVKMWNELTKKREMTVFSWTADGNETDTLFSSWDSLNYYKQMLHMGMMSMEPGTGKIKAWVGGVDFKYFKYDQVKQGYRQPGSTFKPLLYSAAMDINLQRYNPCTKVLDVPVTFEPSETGSGESWTPKNAGPYSGEEMTLRQAMARSVNTAAAKLVKELTPQRLVSYARDKFGFKYMRDKHFNFMLSKSERADGVSGYNKKPINAVPALCLGTEDVSIYELTAAYGTFFNKGVWTEPLFITRIEDKHGRVIAEFTPQKIEALSEEKAYLMTYMLRGSNEESGGTTLGLHRYNFKKDKETGQVYQVGGKTGTTSNFSDAWFVGATSDFMTGVWSGGENRSIHFRSITYGQGARQAMPAAAIFMDKVYADSALCSDLNYTRADFAKPSRPLSVRLDCIDELIVAPDSALVENDSLVQEVDSQKQEYFIPSDVDDEDEDIL